MAVSQKTSVLAGELKQNDQSDQFYIITQLRTNEAANMSVIGNWWNNGDNKSDH